MRRVLGLLLATFAAGFVPAANAADHLDVVINGGATVSIAGNDLSHQPGLLRCKTVYQNGDPSRVDDEGDTSLQEIAAAAGVAAPAVDHIDIERGGGSSGEVRISGDEVRGGFTGDPNPLCTDAMVFFKGPGDGFKLFRPLRADGHPNSGDNIDLGGDDTLTLDLTTTNTTHRTVNTTYDTRSPDANVATGFGASVANPGGGDPYTYQWNFGDGTAPVRGQTPSHAFAPGSWKVTVTASGSDGSYGISDPITIDVAGKATPTPSATPTPGSTPTAEGTAGDPDPHAPNSGGALPTIGPVGSPTPGGTGTPTAAPRTTTTPRPHASSTPTPRGSRTATATATPSGTVTNPFGNPAPPPAVTGVATAAPTSAATQPPGANPGKKATPTPTPTQTQTPPAPASGVPISGILLAGVGDQADLAKILQSVNQAQATATERRQVRQGRGASRDWLGWTSGGGLLLLLLAGGAARERRKIAA